MTAPWWTAADQAEIDLLWTEFLFALDSHEARCGQCRDQLAGVDPSRCDEFGDTIMAIVEYREMRSLASYAVGMRQMQAVIDELGLGGLTEPGESLALQRSGLSQGERTVESSPEAIPGSVSSSLPSNVVPIRRVQSSR